MEELEGLYDLRQRVLNREEVSAKEYKEVLDSLLDPLRKGRVTAAEKKGSSKATVKEIDPDDIFG